jgi:hypothetical protein
MMELKLSDSAWPGCSGLLSNQTVVMFEVIGGGGPAGIGRIPLLREVGVAVWDRFRFVRIFMRIDPSKLASCGH